jgi:hypothetical protein
MKGYWNNLRPLEKRLVVGFGVMVFVILNFWFVVPHFSDWRRIQGRMGNAVKTVNLFEAEIAQTNKYSLLVKSLESEGLSVPQEEQSMHFASTIQSQAAQTVGQIQSTGKQMSRTTPDSFFLELSQLIVVQSREQQLVDFLYNLGSGNSLIRVRGLTLHPDQSHQQLAANVTLVASYQKKPMARSASAPAEPAAPKAATPAAKTPAGPRPGEPVSKKGAAGPKPTGGPGNTPIVTKPGGPTNKLAAPNPKRP